MKRKNDVYDQLPYSNRFDWGLRGVRNAVDRGDIVVIVDVLSFSSTVVSAIQHGAIIYPFPMKEGADEFGRLVKAKVLKGRAESLASGGASLSPISFSKKDKDCRYVLTSLNGALCSRRGRQAPTLLIGCLLNAPAVASTIKEERKKNYSAVSVIACGEHWLDPKEEENYLRPCIEDYLGAGAILAGLAGSKSPEAQVCENGFIASKSHIQQLIEKSSSGVELIEKGFKEDVAFASQLNQFSEVPILVDEHFKKWTKT